jgi:hypothetical protein
VVNFDDLPLSEFSFCSFLLLFEVKAHDGSHEFVDIDKKDKMESCFPDGLAHPCVVVVYFLWLMLLLAFPTVSLLVESVMALGI